jgi:hypothetical protein
VPRGHLRLSLYQGPWWFHTRHTDSGVFADVLTIQHAAYLSAADVFVTADRRLVNELESIRKWAPAPYAAAHRIGGPPASPTTALASLAAGGGVG